MSRIEIADPLIALPRLEKRIKIRRGEDQDSVRLKDAANFADRPRRVGQMLDDVFDDDHAESRICKRQILRAGCLKLSSLRFGLGAGDRPMI